MAHIATDEQAVDANMFCHVGRYVIARTEIEHLYQFKVAEFLVALAESAEELLGCGTVTGQKDSLP